MGDLVLNSLKNLLEHAVEDNNFQDPELTTSVLRVRTDGVFRVEDQIFKEIRETPFQQKNVEDQLTQEARAKVTVAIKALSNAKEHLGHIEKLLSKYIVL